jgi:hypothetical protein
MPNRLSRESIDAVVEFVHAFGCCRIDLLKRMEDQTI